MTKKLNSREQRTARAAVAPRAPTASNNALGRAATEAPKAISRAVDRAAARATRSGSRQFDNAMVDIRRNVATAEVTARRGAALLGQDIQRALAPRSARAAPAPAPAPTPTPSKTATKARKR